MGTLTAKPMKKARKAQNWNRGSKLALSAMRQDVERAEAGPQVGCEDADQHDRAADQGVDEELDRCVLSPRTAPDPDEEVHRNEEELPEEEEQDVIKGDEDAVHRGLERQHPGEELLLPVGDVPRCDNGQHTDDSGDEEHRVADAVDADVVTHADAGDPVDFLLKLDAWIGGIERSPHAQDQGEGHQGDDQCPLAVDVVVLLGKEQTDDGSQERDEYDERECHSFLTPYYAIDITRTSPAIDTF